ncbi:MAG: bifunctional phosphopantothenoylcysteine decarboxylase/phosphopantothenate--cysteine ligase CoaBC, partial [Bacteroidetes bacterium]
LVRLLVKAGAEVRVVMTRAATDFISPLTLSTLSRHEVYTHVHDEGSWHSHVELGLWADAMVVAPATAHTLARMAQGLCDDMLTAVYLSARCPVWVAPAMDLDMWQHPATQRNLRTLQADGVGIIPVGEGELASGLHGPGRMAEPEDIVAFLDEALAPQGPLAGRTVLVTAGPTHEPLDPVRFLGNRSTGKMGIAIAEELARRGAHVQLILGPTQLRPTHPDVEVVPVRTAEQMHAAAVERFAQADAAILAAAVADYRPATVATEKIKKQGDELTLRLVRTPDIAATLGRQKKPGQVLVGFALETENERANALGKLQRKNMDFIVLNSLRDEGAGFAHDTNKVTILSADGTEKPFPLKSKREVAADIVDELARRLADKE